MGRKIASQLGATLYALAPETSGDNDRWISETGIGGADKVVLLSGEFAADEVRAESLVPGLSAVVHSLHPRLILMAESARARLLAARLASEIKGLMLSDATVVERNSQLHVEEWSCGRRQRRSLNLSELAHPLVATISTANVEPQKGEDDADVIFFKSPPALTEIPELLHTSNGLDALQGAELIVCAGMGAAPLLPLVDELARALGGVRASTKSLWRAGLAEKDSVVDWEFQRVSPRLYVICGASGSASHLGAVTAGAHVITLGRDPFSASMRAATYGLLGELELLLPTLTQKADALVSAGGKR